MRRYGGLAGAEHKPFAVTALAQSAASEVASAEVTLEERTFGK